MLPTATNFISSWLYHTAPSLDKRNLHFSFFITFDEHMLQEFAIQSILHSNMNMSSQIGLDHHGLFQAYQIYFHLISQQLLHDFFQINRKPFVEFFQLLLILPYDHGIYDIQ